MRVQFCLYRLITKLKTFLKQRNNSDVTAIKAYSNFDRYTILKWDQHLVKVFSIKIHLKIKNILYI